MEGSSYTVLWKEVEMRWTREKNAWQAFDDCLKREQDRLFVKDKYE